MTAALPRELGSSVIPGKPEPAVLVQGWEGRYGWSGPFILLLVDSLQINQKTKVTLPKLQPFE